MSRVPTTISLSIEIKWYYIYELGIAYTEIKPYTPCTDNEWFCYVILFFLLKIIEYKVRVPIKVDGYWRSCMIWTLDEKIGSENYKDMSGKRYDSHYK